MFRAHYTYSVVQHPTDATKLLVKASITATKTTVEARPSKHIVFVTDVSGSMNLNKRMNILQKGVLGFLDNMHSQDEATLISFSSEPKIEFKNIKGCNLNRALADGRTPIDIINDLKPYGDTHLEKALALIGDKELPINDAANLIIIPVTDGENTKKNFEEQSMKQLVTNCKGQPIVLPFGVSSNSIAASLSKLCHTGTGNTEEFFINDQDSDPQKMMDDSLRRATAYIAEQTPDAVTLSVSLGGDQQSFAMGKLLKDIEVVRVFEFSKPANGDQAQLSITSTLGDAILPEVEVKEDSDVVAAYVLQQYKTRVSGGRVEGNELKAIVNELLALLPKNNNESDVVKATRNMLQNVLSAREAQDLAAALRAASATTTSHYSGTMTTVFSKTQPNHGPNTLAHGAAVSKKPTSSAVPVKSSAPTSSSSSSAAASQSVQPKVHSPQRINAELQSWKIDYVTNTAGIAAITSPKDAKGVYIRPRAAWILQELNGFPSSNLMSVEEILGKVVYCTVPFAWRSKSQSNLVSVRLNGFAKDISCDNLEFGVGLENANNAFYMAPLVASFAAEVARKGYLKGGKVRQFKGIGLNGVNEHTFVIYSNSQANELYLLDVTNPNRQVFNLKNSNDRKELEQSYKKRGLAGTLDFCYGCYRIEYSENLKIDPVLIDAIKDEEAFKNKGLYCPITCQVPQDPVVLGDESNQVYEREAIEAWVKQYGTSPITRKAYALADVRSATIARQDIIVLIQEQRDVAPAVANSPAQRMSSEKIQERVALGSVNANPSTINMDPEVSTLQNEIRLSANTAPQNVAAVSVAPLVAPVAVKAAPVAPIATPASSWRRVLAGSGVGFLVGAGAAVALSLTLIPATTVVAVLILAAVVIAPVIIGAMVGGFMSRRADAAVQHDYQQVNGTHARNRVAMNVEPGEKLQFVNDETKAETSTNVTGVAFQPAPAHSFSPLAKKF